LSLLAACQPAGPLPQAPQPVLAASPATAPAVSPPSAQADPALSTPDPQPPKPVLKSAPEPQPPAPAPSPMAEAPPPESPSAASGSSGSAGSFSAGAGVSSTSTAAATPTPAPTVPPAGRPVLDDLRLMGGGSVLGANAPDALIPDFAGKTIQLEALGYFFVQPGDALRLTLDNSIELELSSVSNTRLVAQLNTAYLADLYLSGPHKLVLQTPLEAQHHQIKIGPPTQTLALQAQIETVNVIRDANQTPLYLEVTGRQLMLNPNFAQLRLGGEVAIIFDSQLTPDGLVTLQAALPDPTVFAQPGNHSLQYQDPFSLAFKSFSS